MQIESTRFGKVEVRDDAVMSFPDGLIGLPGTLYALLAQDPDSPFMWLHAVEHPEVAVPVINPWLFFPDYEVRMSDDDARAIELEDSTKASILCVVRAGEELADFKVNLVAPIVLHADALLGRQIINDVRGYAVDQPLFSEVQLSEITAAASPLPVAASAG